MILLITQPSPSLTTLSSYQVQLVMCMHMHVFVYIHVYMYMCVYIDIYIYTCMYMYTFIHKHLYLYWHIQSDVHILICIVTVMTNIWDFFFLEIYSANIYWFTFMWFPLSGNFALFFSNTTLAFSWNRNNNCYFILAFLFFRFLRLSSCIFRCLPYHLIPFLVHVILCFVLFLYYILTSTSSYILSYILIGFLDVLTGVLHSWRLSRSLPRNKHVTFSMASHFLLLGELWYGVVRCDVVW